MGVRIEVMTRGSVAGSQGLVLKRPVRVYSINDDLTDAKLRNIEQLLSDPIVDDVARNRPILDVLGDSTVVEVAPKPGVNDPEGNAVKTAIEGIIGHPVGEVSFSRQYLWKGPLSEHEYTGLKKTLGNTIIHEFRRVDGAQWDRENGAGFSFPSVNLPRANPYTYANITISDTDLMKISDQRLLALNLEEMRAIRDLFHDTNFVQARSEYGLQAHPTDAELEALAQTWSEHCIHKKFKGRWVYTSDDPSDESGLPPVVDNMFQSVIVASTERIARNISWLVSVFEDNAGVIRLNERWNIAHKVETHNHPSGLDGFGGANTGTGGVFRDPNATGIGMTIVSSQYGFRVPHPDSYPDLPSDIQSPRQTLAGIVAGVEDYGNKMGIPTACGQVFFDKGFLKPGVFVGAVGVAPAEINGRPTHKKEIKSGYIALSLGGRVGKDGIHGATGSSTDLAADAEKNAQINQSVQIGDPVVEKCVFDVIDVLRDSGLVEALQDCGAGGWNSALGELARLSNGAVLDLTHAPEKYAGLAGWEKLISEAQERQVVVIKPEHLQRVADICEHFNVEATQIATFNNSGYYRVVDQDQTIVYLPMDFLHRGLPQMTIKAHWKPSENKEPDIPFQADLTTSFLQFLGQPNVQIHDWIMTRYDHEVQGGSFIKPITGIGRGKSDAIAYRPVLTEKEVVIETWGSNPWQGDIDAYHMGRNNVVDAIGRVIAAGGNLEKIVFNGNTICPKPEKDPIIAAKVLRMIKGAADAEIAFGTPTISGKDSTSMERAYNSTATGQEVRVKAKPELLMSALAILPDESTLTTPDLKLPGDLVYVVGQTRDELGASEFYLMNGETGRNVPASDLAEIKMGYNTLSGAIKDQLVHSAQYIAKGGLAAALANAAIAGDLGIDIRLDPIDDGLGRADKLLFSETTGRFVVTVHPSKQAEFEAKMQGTYVQQIGHVTIPDTFSIAYKDTHAVSTSVAILREKNKGDIRL